MDWLSHLGYVLELLGLGVAARGMWRSARAQGAALWTWPAWMPTAYLRVARLFGYSPRPTETKVYAGVAEATLGPFEARGAGRVAGATVDDRLNSLEADVDELRIDALKLADQQQAHKQALDSAVKSLRSEIASVQGATEQRLSDQTVTDLRPAAKGVILAAFGLLLQWIGSF
jgi:hypothetical protein